MTLDRIDLEKDVQQDREQHSTARERLRKNLEDLEKALREARINEKQIVDAEATPRNTATHWRWPWQH